MFLNIPASTHILIFKSRLILIGNRGKFIFKSFGNYSNHYKLIVGIKQICIQKTTHNGFLTFSCVNLVKVFNQVKLNIWGSNNMYEKQISLFGTGFRLWIKKLHNDKILLLRLGLSEDIFIKIPKSLVILPIRGNLVRIIGLEIFAVSEFAAFLKHQIKKDIYKGKGLHYGLDNKLAILKTGKKN